MRANTVKQHKLQLSNHWTLFFGLWIALIIPLFAFGVSYSQADTPLLRVYGETLRSEGSIASNQNVIANDANTIVGRTLEQRALLDPNQIARVQATAELNRLRQGWVLAIGVAMADWDAVVTAPRDSKHVVIAVQRDLWISHDGGATFERIANVLPSVVNSLAINAANQNILYAGVDGLGFYTSQDGGKTWQPSNTGIRVTPGARFGITAIAVDPSAAEILYIASGVWLDASRVTYHPLGILKTTDGGKTWTQLETETVQPIQYLLLDADTLHTWSEGQRTSYKIN